MDKHEVEIGGVYVVRESGMIINVRIDAKLPPGGWPSGGWIGTNMSTRRSIHIRSAARLRRRAESLALAAWWGALASYNIE